MRLHVMAVGDLLSPRFDADGRPIPGRFAGRAADRTALPDGEEIPDCADARRAIAVGDLELIAEVA